MKLCYIADSHVPSRTANSLQIMHMCQALVQLGHQVQLIVRRARGSDIIHTSPWEWYGMSHEFPIVWLRGSGHLGSWDFAIRSCVRALRNRVDLVVTRHSRSALTACTLGIPTIFEEHTVAPPGDRALLRRLLRSASLRRAVAISDGLKQEMQRVLAPANLDGVEVLPDGVELERFDHLDPPQQARNQLQLEWSSTTVGYAGHLYPGKGADFVAHLGCKMEDYEFIIVGGMDPDIDRLREWVSRQSAPNVHVIGFVPNRELPGYLAACDILLLPYERSVLGSGGGRDLGQVMSPLKMFEYMATGRPIIASDLPVLREVLNENNCLLCQPGNIGEWQRTIMMIANDSELATALSSNAKRDVQKYSWVRRAERMIQLAEDPM